MIRGARGVAVLALSLLAGGPARAADDPAGLIGLLAQPGHAALMRHATAPGVGDPPGFDPADCGTQRNLSDEGRAEARRIGEDLRALGLKHASVLTSAWCRAAETATLLGFGEPVHAPELDNIFGNRAAAGPRTAELHSLLGRVGTEGAAILVTHGVNITAAAGVVPASGELVILRVQPGSLPEVVGRLRPGEGRPAPP